MSKFAIDASTSKILPFGYAKRHGVVFSLSEEGESLLIIKAGVSSEVLSEVQRIAGLSHIFKEVEESEFNRLLGQSYQNEAVDTKEMVADIGEGMDLALLADSVPETEDLLEQEDDAPIIRLINALLSEAVKSNASDIHIETFEKRLVVRFRIDGLLQEIVQPKRQLAPLLVSRIKVMAKLDIAEKRLPQDGRISLRLAGREIDIRVSTLPSHNGERIVLRLLDKNASRLNLSALGMAEETLRSFQSLLDQPHGIILVTGPTGSGKTTTLYGGLSILKSEHKNILTVEDPIEYNIEGIGQTQVNGKNGMNFAKGLRAILRQDPDIVMIGEIRDLETAEIAVQASLTGHLVLSTLHTNSAVGALIRLEDIGIESFLLSSSLIGVLAQRLVRVLCSNCKVGEAVSEYEMSLLSLSTPPQQIIYHPKGCEKCNYHGYKGRTGIYELITLDAGLRELIHNRSSEQQIDDYVRSKTPSIRQDGFNKILQGQTSIEEVLSVTREN